MVTEGGETLAQSQAILRYVGRMYRGKNNELLYPGKDDCEASYEIDELVEYANDFLKYYTFMIPKFKSYYDPSPEKANEFIVGQWTNMLLYVQIRLDRKTNHLFLVGDSITLADIALGAHFMMILHNPHVAHSELFDNQMKTYYPVVANWVQKTVHAHFNDWFQAQPHSEFKEVKQEASPPPKTSLRITIDDSAAEPAKMVATVQ